MATENDEGPRVYFSRRERLLAFWQDHSVLTWLAKLVPIVLVIVGEAILILAGVPLLVPNPATPGNPSIRFHLIAAIGAVLGLFALSAGAWAKPPRSPGERFGIIIDRMNIVKDDLEKALSDLRALQQTAIEVEQRARDNQALSRLTSEQFDAWQRDLKRRDRVSMLQQLGFTVAGIVIGFLLTQYVA